MSWIIETDSQYCHWFQVRYQHHNCFNFKNQSSHCDKENCPIKVKTKDKVEMVDKGLIEFNYYGLYKED